MALSFSPADGKLSLGGFTPNPKSMAGDLVKQELFTTASKYAKELYNWKEPSTSESYVPKEKRAEILATFDAVLGLEKGTTTDYVAVPTARGDTAFKLVSSGKDHTVFRATMRSKPGQIVREIELTRDSESPK